MKEPRRSLMPYVPFYEDGGSLPRRSLTPYVPFFNDGGELPRRSLTSFVPFFADGGYTPSDQMNWYNPNFPGYMDPNGQQMQGWHTPMSMGQDPNNMGVSNLAGVDPYTMAIKKGQEILGVKDGKDAINKLVKMGNEAAIGSIFAADALLPNHRDIKNIRPQMKPDNYNQFPQGNGSQAIMEYGGKMTYGDGGEPWSDYSTRGEYPYRNEGTGRHHIQVTQDDNTFYETPASQHTPYPIPQHIPQYSQFPITQAIGTEPLYDQRFYGNRSLNSYAPISQGMDPWERYQMTQQYPDYANDVPIQKSMEQMKELGLYNMGGPVNAKGMPGVNGIMAARKKFGKKANNGVNILDGGEDSELQDYDVAKSGIHIDTKNRGKFNALKKKTGKSTEELTHSKNPLTRKRAVFAQNASHWKKGKDGMNIGDEMEISETDLQNFIKQGYQFDML